MRPIAQLAVERDAELPVVHVAGEIDASNAAEIGARLRDAVTNRSRALLVDLRETTYLDSAAMNLLFELAAELDERRQRLHIVIGDGAPIRRVAAITGLDAVAPIHPTVDAAQRAAAG